MSHTHLRRFKSSCFKCNLFQRKDDEHAANPKKKRIDILNLLVEYLQTLSREKYLFDSGVGDMNRLIKIVTNNGIHLLSISEEWFGGGTFKLCLEMFFQLYTGHA